MYNNEEPFGQMDWNHYQNPGTSTQPNPGLRFNGDEGDGSPNPLVPPVQPISVLELELPSPNSRNVDQAYEDQNATRPERRESEPVNPGVKYTRRKAEGFTKLSETVGKKLESLPVTFLVGAPHLGVFWAKALNTSTPSQPDTLGAASEMIEIYDRLVQDLLPHLKNEAEPQAVARYIIEAGLREYQRNRAAGMQ